MAASGRTGAHARMDEQHAASRRTGDERDEDPREARLLAGRRRALLGLVANEEHHRRGCGGREHAGHAEREGGAGLHAHR